MANIDHSKKEFSIIFKIAKDVIFCIEYFRTGSNQDADFKTDATIYYPNHRGWCCSGQCQESALVIANDEARAKGRGCSFVDFYNKWNKEHLHHLNAAKLKELHKDIANLKKYNYPQIEACDGAYEDYTCRYKCALIREGMPRKLSDDAPVRDHIEFE